ncbi:MAG TPA: bifunctional precorrin-2 dehydrogenase/sirohydrochlorin ferrochelatase [Thermoanaerobaculia bacterium]|nr:bifunctional precorrin-2 dehydrogenase/sirohydrochlorin ferrochelatase [Thermoanaerobaculia bacterium]
MPKKFPWYPIFLDLEGRDVLIVGGGNVCARKAETMLRYGARVTIVSPEVNGEIAQWEREGTVVVRRKRYEEADLDGTSIVIASTDDTAVNEQVAADCRRRRIPVNVVDVTPLCEFIVPAIVEEGSIQIAISTGGKSPALARTLKEELREIVSSACADLNDVLGSLRDGAKATLPTDADRKVFFDGILARGVLGMMRSGRRREAWETIARACEEAGVPLSEELRNRLADPVL